MNPAGAPFRRRSRVVLGALLLLSAMWLASGAQAGDTFACQVDRVTDGDTFRCADGTKVRVWGINAPESDDAAGPASTATLTAMIDGRDLACEARGKSYDRIVAACTLDGYDVGAAMVIEGMARDCPRYSKGAYAHLEDERHAALPMAGFCEP